jgi:hypothetical protein
MKFDVTRFIYRWIKSRYAGLSFVCSIASLLATCCNISLDPVRIRVKAASHNLGIYTLLAQSWDPSKLTALVLNGYNFI